MIISESMKKLHKLTALSDELSWFFKDAFSGKMQKSELSGAKTFGSQQNPVSMGLSDGYSAQDIAHFYIARELGSDWVEKILEHLDDEFLCRLKVAFNEFSEDVRSENRFVVDEMRRRTFLNDQSN